MMVAPMRADELRIPVVCGHDNCFSCPPHLAVRFNTALFVRGSTER